MLGTELVAPAAYDDDACDDDDDWVDQEDWEVADEIMKGAGRMDWAAENVFVCQENDAERRLHKLLLQYYPCAVLPESLGQLEKVVALNLVYSKITSLPSSIGELKNLETLDLGNTGSLRALPREIGRLASLRDLNLRRSSIASLPQEIGQLASLRKLSLCHSNIASLPPSIGNLKNLEILDLQDTTRLLQLPEELGNLEGLKALNLYGSGISSLPPSVYRTKDLLFLNILGTNLPQVRGDQATMRAFLSELGRRFESLGSMGYWTDRALSEQLAFNRARHRIPVGLPPNTWPMALHSAWAAFGMYPIVKENNLPYRCGWIPRSEAIYKLLSIERKSFVKFLVNRTTNSSVPPSATP